MKITRKTVAEFYATLKAARSRKSKADHMMRVGKNDSDYFPARKAVAELEELEDQMHNVCVSFYIGSRKYCEKAIKVGKSYFNKGTPMTKSNGFWGIQEVEKITEEMKHEMHMDICYY